MNILYQASNAVVENVRALFQKRVSDAKLAYLGDKSGEGARVDVPGLDGYVYIRFPAGKDTNGNPKYSEPSTCRATGVAYPNFAGAPVYVAVRYNNEVEIVSAHYKFLDKIGINTQVLNPLNQQSKWVYPWQLTYGYASAVSTALTGSTRVMVKKIRHYVGNLFTAFETPLEADKPDLASYIPATGEHCYAALWIDTYTNTAVITTSTAQSMDEPLDATDIQECAVERPPDAIPLKAFYLSNDQTKLIQNVNDVDLRQWLDNPVLWGFPKTLTTKERIWPGRTLVVGPYTLSGEGALTVESGGQILIVHQSNITATAPTINDDSGDGYSVGSLWFDTSTDILYFASDVTMGAAVWESVAGDGGSATDPNAIHVNVDNEINGIAPKTTLVDDDVLVGEDSEDSYAKFSTTMADIATYIGSVGAIYPNGYTMNQISSRVIAGNAFVYDKSTNLITGRTFQNTAAINDEWENGFYCRAGTFNLIMFGNTASTHGITTIKVDGVTQGTLDWYTLGPTDNVNKTLSITVLTDGWHVLNVTMATKNALSTNYFCVIGLMTVMPAGGY